MSVGRTAPDLRTCRRAGVVAAIAALLVLSGAVAASPVHPASPLTGRATGLSVLPSTDQLREEATLKVLDDEPGSDPVGPAGPGPAPDTSLPIIVTLVFSNGSTLGALLAELNDPASPGFHRYLTEPAFDERFGGAPGAYAALAGFVRSSGVRDVITYADRTTLAFDATPQQVREIFGVTERMYAGPGGRPYYAPDRAPTLPAALAPFVAGVQGLSDDSSFLQYTDLSSTLARTAPGPAAAPSAGAKLKPTPCASAGGPFGCTTVDGISYPLAYGNLSLSSQLQVPYDSETLLKSTKYATGVSIATILWVNTIANSSGWGAYCQSLNASNWAAPFDPSDVSGFFDYTIPAKEPKPHAFGVPILDGSGQAPAPGPSAQCDSGGANFESTLDVDMAGSMAPGADVYEVYGDSSSSSTTDLALADLLNPNASEGAGMTPAVVAGLKNVSVVSNSFGTRVYNDTSWYSDLQHAEARGITLFAATPDAGGNDTTFPAAMAYADFGDVAVGGTTIDLNATTLDRTNEVVWYEGPGSNRGTSGGVANTTVHYLGCGTGHAQCFPEPAWQATSPDANGVIRAVGNGRGEPDIAAIANNTVISLTWQGTSYPVNCTVQGCAFFISTGDSIATPIEAGLFAEIDHALAVQGQGWVGFPDPLLYPLGGLELNGTLGAKSGGHPFFDVTSGANANFSALAGYDLATGWGPIEAGNLTEYLLPHSVTFAEKKLPSGTRWSVTLGGVTASSTTSTIVFAEATGAYAFGVPSAAGLAASPSSGTVRVLGSNVKLTITF